MRWCYYIVCYNFSLFMVKVTSAKLRRNFFSQRVVDQPMESTTDGKKGTSVAAFKDKIQNMFLGSKGWMTGARSPMTTAR